MKAGFLFVEILARELHTTSRDFFAFNCLHVCRFVTQRSVFMSTVQENPTSSAADKLLQELLRDQQDTTAVERFSQRLETDGAPSHSDCYRDLIPLSEPKAGEQYAFEVDLDACSGCKACVAACHNLNGLEQEEQWRNVGLLHGDQQPLQLLQHVTTACHHCLDPGCLTGCPVKAYEKDSTTGIVRHLDDQCFGCQYCVLMCPYEVPQYSPSKGIVRKCDMCHDRLSEGEAPACVQACPTHAIRIRTVEVDAVVERSLHEEFLPTAPDPCITHPTTRYKSSKPELQNLLAADHHTIRPAHGHFALVFMLVLTQASVGAFVLSRVLTLTSSLAATQLGWLPLGVAAVALIVGIVGMNAALLHLGRPQYAYRALLGLRTSWLSREILGFGLYAGLAASFTVTLWFADTKPRMSSFADCLGWAAALSGLVAVLCSAMIYVKTQRPFWNLGRTVGIFALSCLVGGAPLVLLSILAIDLASDRFDQTMLMREFGRPLLMVAPIATLAKLALEFSAMRWLRHETLTPRKRTAILLTGQLRACAGVRLAAAVVGGLILPMLLLSTTTMTSTGLTDPSLVYIFASALMFVALLIGELSERYLFFAASVAPKMPGRPCP